MEIGAFGRVTWFDDAYQLQNKIGFGGRLGFFPLRNKPETLARYVIPMRRAGLVVTAGTEHNTRDLIPLEPACLNAAPPRSRE